MAAAAADSGAVDSHRADAVAAAAAEAEEGSDSSVGEWLQLEAGQKSAGLLYFSSPLRQTLYSE